MLSLTRKADYAIVAMAELAHRCASLTSARELSSLTQIPLPVMTNILHQLHSEGLVDSVRGSKGGYELARDPKHISLAEMIEAIEGEFRLTVCCVNDSNSEVGDECDLAGNCHLREPVQRVHQQLRQFLSEVTLAQLACREIPIEITITTDGNSSSRSTTATV